MPGTDEREEARVTGPAFLPVSRVVPIAAPAVGADFDIVNNDVGPWVVRALRFVLTTSAVVANRQVTLVADDGTTAYFATRAPSVQVGGGVVSYAGFDGAADSGIAAVPQIMAWPARGLVLPVGYRLRSVTALIDAGDQYSAIGLWVDQHPSGYFGTWHAGPAPYLTEEQ